MASFAIAGAITPGPVNVLAMQHGRQSQRVCAMLFVLGSSISYAMVVWIMGRSGQWLLQDAAVARYASWLCAAYLMWLAWGIARAPVADADTGHGAQQQSYTPSGLAPCFMQGAMLQALNPKAWLVALSGVGLFVLPLSAQGTASTQSALAWFCVISLLACMMGVGCWALMGNVMKRWLRNARRQRAFNMLLAAVLVASVFGMLA